MVAPHRGYPQDGDGEQRDPCGRYFVSMACEVEIAALPVRKNAIGVDVGVKDVAVTSEDFKSGAAKYTYRYARQLKMAQRRLSKKRKGSHRWRNQQSLEFMPR